MALQATFKADFTSWDSAIKNAQANLRAFEPAVKGAQSQLQRLASSFAGGPIIRDAKLVATAIQQIGGVSNLTASEAAKASNTITEALAKLKATSQAIPPELQKIADELGTLKQAGSGVEDVGTSFGKMAASIATGEAVFELAKRGLESLTGFVESSVDAYARAQKAQEGMVQALRQVGQATPQTIGQMNALAAQFQDTTVYSDDLINEMESLFIQVGHVGPDQMNKALEAATNLSAGLGIDLREATIQVSKAIEGHTQGLQKLGINIDAAAIKTEGASAVFDALNARFGGQATAQMTTYAGAVARVANEWDNLKEAVGDAIVNDDRVKQGLQDLPQTIKAATTEVVALIGAFKELQDEEVTLGRFFTGTSKSTFEFGQKAAAAARDLATSNTEGPPIKGIAEAEAAYNALAKTQQYVNATAGEGLAVWDAQNAAMEKAAAAAKAAAEKFQTLHDQLVGNDVIAGLRSLNAQWDAMTPAEQAQAVALGRVIKQYQELASNVVTLPPDLRAFAVAMNAAAEATGKMEIPLSLLKPFFEGLGTQVATTTAQLEKWDAMLGVGFEQSIPLLDVTKGLGTHFSELPDHIKKSTDALEELSQAFSQLAQVSGGSFGGVVQEIGQVVAALNLAQKAVKQIAAGREQGGVGGAITTATGLVSGAAAVGSVTGSGSTAKRTGAGALTGAEVGSAFGPIGSAVGAGIGALTGLFRGLSNSEKKTVNKMRQDFVDAAGGLDALNKHAQSAGKTLDNLLHASNVKSYQAAVDDLNAAFEKHDADIQKLIGDLQTYGKTGTLATKEVLAGLAKIKPGTDEAAAAFQYLTDNTATALSGLTDFGKEGQKVTAGTAQALGASLGSVFQQLQDQGASLPEALAKVQPALEELKSEFIDAGVSGGAAFDNLIALSDIASDKIAGPAITAVGDLDKVIVGLANNGSLTQDEFSGLGDQVADTFDTLQKQGFDSNKVLELMQPTLQDLWESQQEFGFKTDDATQKLLDQAATAGIVGEKFKTPQEKMQKAVQDLIDKMGELIDKITGTGGLVNALGSIPKTTTYTVEGRYSTTADSDSDGGPQTHGGAPPSGPPDGTPGHAKGGLFKHKHKAWIAEGGRSEIVGDQGFMTKALTAAMNKTGGSHTGAIRIEVPVHLDGAQITKVVAKRLPGYLKGVGA